MSVEASEITEAREDIDALIFPDTAVVLELVTEDDGEGGLVEVEWKAVRETPCRLEPYGGPTSSRGAGGEGGSHAAERVDSRVTHIVVFPANTPISLENRLEILGTTYEVNVLRRFGDWELTRRVEVKEKL